MLLVEGSTTSIHTENVSYRVALKGWDFEPLTIKNNEKLQRPVAEMLFPNLAWFWDSKLNGSTCIGKNIEYRNLRPIAQTTGVSMNTFHNFFLTLPLFPMYSSIHWKKCSSISYIYLTIKNIHLLKATLQTKN